MYNINTFRRLIKYISEHLMLRNEDTGHTHALLENVSTL
jgi:hypothetical protein